MIAARALHQIEVTSRCDLRCVYCPSPNLKRPKVDMSPAHFTRAIDLATGFYRAQTQFELNLAGIGESTLHPMFPRFITEARAAMPAITLTFATNGLNLSKVHPRSKTASTSPDYRAALAVVDALSAARRSGRVEVYVSLHRPERAALAVEVLQDLGLLKGVSNDPALNADDWAGQVEWSRSHQTKYTCQWLRDGKVFAMADGRVSTCCLDASGSGVVGTLEQDPSVWTIAPFSLCRTCQYQLPEGLEQQGVQMPPPSDLVSGVKK